MAGDWMKIDLELPDKPEVHAIAGMLNIDPNAVVGMLIRVWQWFDKHTTDGNAHGVTYSLPDRISGVIGFGEAMAFVGWLEQHDKTLVMPRFDRHTSQSAKTRALTAKRVANHKGKSNAETNASSVSDSLPREEKRRDKEYMSGKPDPAEQKPRRQNFTAEATEVLDHLNKVAGTKFQPVAANLNLIAARLREGFTVDMVKAVVNRQHREWGAGDMRKYLRPETLFNATKFAGYAGQAESAAIPEKPTMTREAYEAKRKAENASARERYQREQEAITVGGAQ